MLDVVCSIRRILFVEKGDIFGHWNCEWEYTWDQIRPPQTCSEGVKILLKEPKKKGLFHAKENGKIINLPSTQVAEVCFLKLPTNYYAYYYHRRDHL